MREFFDASTPAADVPPTTDTLGRLEDVVLEQHLHDVLDSLEELVADLAADEQADAVGPDEITALETVSGGDDAPLEFRSIRRRVHEGRLTWTEFWQRPEDEGQAGLDLLFAALGHIAAALPERLAEARLAAGLPPTRAEPDGGAAGQRRSARSDFS
jgi:hypothetical protein